MKVFFSIITLLIATLLFGQDHNAASLRLSPSNKHDLYVRFENGIISKDDLNFTSQAMQKVGGLEELQREYNIQLIRGIQITDQQFSAMADREFLVSKSSDKVENLRSIFQIKIENSTNAMMY